MKGSGWRFATDRCPCFGRGFRTRTSRPSNRGRSSWIDGWGIHWIPGRGYTYNLWGFSCAKLDVRGRTVRIGSDDADKLVEFLKSKLPQKA